jgi:hypothetical protein
VDRGWPAFPRRELSREEWTDSLASIRPVGITVSGPFDSGIDRLWSASFLTVRSNRKRVEFRRKQSQNRTLSDAAITHQSIIPPGEDVVSGDLSRFTACPVDLDWSAALQLFR